MKIIRTTGFLRMASEAPKMLSRSNIPTDLLNAIRAVCGGQWTSTHPFYYDTHLDRESQEWAIIHFNGVIPENHDYAYEIGVMWKIRRTQDASAPDIDEGPAGPGWGTMRRTRPPEAEKMDAYRHDVGHPLLSFHMAVSAKAPRMTNWKTIGEDRTSDTVLEVAQKAKQYIDGYTDFGGFDSDGGNDEPDTSPTQPVSPREGVLV